MKTFAVLACLVCAIFAQNTEREARARLCVGNREENSLKMVRNTGCKEFVICNGILATDPQRCALGTLFDDTRKDCVKREQVQCSDTSDCNDGATPGCGSFNICLPNNVQVTFKCGNGTYFSNNALTCTTKEMLTAEEQQACGSNTNQNQYQGPYY